RRRAAGARGGAGGGPGDGRLSVHPRPRARGPASEDAARDRQPGRRRVRGARDRGRGRGGGEVSDPKPVYGPEDWTGDPARQLSDAGAFPFTRGVHPTMYRGKLWTMRQYAGFGTAEETNARFRHLLAAGQTGLSVAFDLPTQMGYDSDHPMAEGEVGRAGVAIDTVDDLKGLFHGIPLDQVSTSMTINATAAVLLAMYVVVGEEQGVPRARLQGTVQNDILKEFIARGTYIYSIEPSLRLVTELCRFVAAERMSFNPISVSGYHMREAGATAVEELAFTFANGLEYLRRAVASGLGGTQSLHTNAYDEALALPTEQSATLALRTQQILAHETGVPETVDPVGGSWYIEALTERMEREARALLDGIEQAGGAAKAVERGVFQEAIAKSAYAAQRAIESGKTVVVGGNEYADDQAIPSVPAPDYSALAAAQRRRVAQLRGKRKTGAVKTALGALEAAARETSAALMEPMLEAVRARATVG